MPKSFLCRRSPTGIAAMTDAMGHYGHDVHKVEKQYGRKSLQAAEPLLILAFLYYVMENYVKAEPLLVRYVAIVKEKIGPIAREVFYGLWLLADTYSGLNRFPDAHRAGLEAKSISKSINFSSRDSLIDALMRQVKAYSGKAGLHSRKHGLVMALATLSWCMTSGFHRSSTGLQVVEGLRSFFTSYGITEEEWGGIVKRAHLRKYDFVGLLSMLLAHTHLAPERVVTVVKARRRSDRVRYHYIGPDATARTSSNDVVESVGRVDSPGN